MVATCPELDQKFIAVVSELERCSSENNDCEGCPLAGDCLILEDWISERCSDRRLTEAYFQEFLSRFKKLHRQADFSLFLPLIEPGDGRKV